MNLKNKVYSNYEEVKKADINEIWEVVILDTYKGTRRLEYLMTEDLNMARKIANNYKNKLENIQEVIVALVAIENGELKERFGRIIYRKQDDTVRIVEEF